MTTIFVAIVRDCDGYDIPVLASLSKENLLVELGKWLAEEKDNSHWWFDSNGTFLHSIESVPLVG